MLVSLKFYYSKIARRRHVVVAFCPGEKRDRKFSYKENKLCLNHANLKRFSLINLNKKRYIYYNEQIFINKTIAA